MRYIKVFEEHSDYEDFVSGGTMELPNVSYCDAEHEVHYNAYIPPLKVVATFNMENSSWMGIVGMISQGEDDAEVYTNSFSEIEVDGVAVSISDLIAHDGMVQATAGNHTVTYTLNGSEIGYRSFYANCGGLVSINIPDGVTSIGERSFAMCPLSSITIPNSVTNIDDEAFYEATSLRSVVINATTPPSIGEGVFTYWYVDEITYEEEYRPLDVTIYVPSGSVNAYKTAPGWSDYASKIQAIP